MVPGPGYTRHWLHKDHHQDSNRQQVEHPIHERRPTILLTATGERMPVDGSAKIKARANGINVSMDVLVSNVIKDEMLVSYKNLIMLQIIPGGFPNTIIQRCREVTRIEPRELLLSEYPDVLSDELSPEPMKTDAPMHIHIKVGATPRKVTTARRVPLRYESEAEKTVQELIEKGVIVPANETTEWCSPKETKSGSGWSQITRS